MVKYIIFDMDGTLLDTEPFYEQSWVETGIKWGLEGICEMYVPLICGASVVNAKRVLKDRFGENFDSDSFIDERMTRYHELVASDLRLKPGCREMLDFLKEQQISMAVATSTVPEITFANLKRVGIFDYFDAVVTATMVINGKPAPDIFIEAGRRIGAIASECMVCEDSYNGIIAGHAANMKTVMIPDMLPPTEETDKLTYATVDSLFDVIELIKKENKIS